MLRYKKYRWSEIPVISICAEGIKKIITDIETQMSAT
jgi:hypothetical protein